MTRLKISYKIAKEVFPAWTSFSSVTYSLMRKTSNKNIKKDFAGQFSFKRVKLDSLFDRASNVRKKLHPKKNFNKITSFIQKRPFTSLFAVLGIFLLLMIIGNILFSPKPTIEQNAQAPKKISVFKLGSAPTASFQGKVEKSGVIKIVAQMPGIVSSINASEGQQVGAGTNILSLSSNYSGGNALSVQRQIAQTQYQNAKDTYQQQGDLIGKQKDLANKSNDNAILMQQIAQQSASDTQALADLNKTIVDTISSNIQTLEATNVNGSNDAAIFQAKQQISQYQSAMVQVNASLRNLQLQGGTNNPPAQIAQTQHDIAIEQLDIQRKALDMNLEISRLSYTLASISEASMFPSTPFGGTIDKIFVHVGDSVNPGTVLASLSGNNQHAEIVVSVPADLARNVSAFEPSIIQLGKKVIQMMPSYVSKDATDGTLYSVIYQLDDSATANLTDSTYVNVEIPIGTANTTNEVPFIPLDSVVQTQEEAYVYVVDAKNVARVKKISLGQIQGNYVEVTSGLPNNSQIILDRNVIEGDKVSVVH